MSETDFGKLRKEVADRAARAYELERLRGTPADQAAQRAHQHAIEPVEAAIDDAAREVFDEIDTRRRGV